MNYARFLSIIVLLAFSISDAWAQMDEPPTVVDPVVVHTIRRLADYGFTQTGTSWVGNYYYRLDGAGSGGFSINQGQQDKPKDPKKDDCSKAGNPIIFSTGNKIEPEMDFSTGGEAPLYLERTYNHFWQGTGIFGRQWVSNFDFILTFDDNLTTAACYPKPGSANCTTLPTQATTVWAHRPDGRQIKFIWNATANAWLEDKPAAVAKIVKNTNGSYTLSAENGNVETYSNYGRVLAIKDVAGIGGRLRIRPVII